MKTLFTSTTNGRHALENMRALIMLGGMTSNGGKMIIIGDHHAASVTVSIKSLKDVHPKQMELWKKDAKEDAA